MIVASSKAFTAIQKVDIETLSRLSERELRPLLPCLVRMALCPPLDVGNKWSKNRKKILKILAGIEIINSLVGLLSIDFHALDVDIKKEQILRQKLGNGKSNESILLQSIENGLAIEFEQSDPPRKLRLVLSELLTVFAQGMVPEVGNIKSSELFDNEIYLEEVADVLCIAQAEVSSLLSLSNIAEGLLNFKCGPELICRLVANAPDSYCEVYTSFILNGPKQEEDNEIDTRRGNVLKMMCSMNPSHDLIVRGFAVENCRMPALAVALTLEHRKQERSLHQFSSKSYSSDFVADDIVSFIIGLLLGSDTQVRLWFSNFVRTSQNKSNGNGVILQALRTELLHILDNVFPKDSDDKAIPEKQVVQASALLKLYCALKGIGGLKFNEEEVDTLLRVIVSHPPSSSAGVHFVSIGLCLLIACPLLIGSSEQEKRAINWIRWLMQEASNFESHSEVTSSFGEMLLLLAIHFHSDQVAAITDLICSNLGMKIPIRTNNLNRLKTIFTHDIFTEKVVTSHAVKVPVTLKLSANMHGFLPVHCIYQLLKSRAFSKHQVPIKDWIYNQICNVEAPLHSVLPLLIEVYITSIIIPSSPGKAIIEKTNKPISDDEILAVFQDSFFSAKEPFDHLSSSKLTPMKLSNPLASQLLVLYYLMLYEDCRLMNMKSIVNSGYKVKIYTDELLSQLPIKYLLQQAQKEQQNYAGLFPSLLKLLASHFPHLCLPQGWIQEIEEDSSVHLTGFTNISPKMLTSSQLDEAFTHINSSPGKLIMMLDAINTLPANLMWKFAKPLVSKLSLLLEEDTPRHLLNKVKGIWWKLNSVMPRRLWVMTIQELQKDKEHGCRLQQDDIVLDPLNVLRCDERVFRCPPIFEIVIHMLKAFLAASFTHLSRHILNNPITSEMAKLNTNGIGVESDADREELKIALVAAQESAAVQILLETCLMTEQEKKESRMLSNLREVQCLVCSHLHQVFIGEPSLAKLVHFQGYPSELIPIAVNGIPSMHICLDFIPELLSQPQLEKQIFGIELISHLSLKYSLPKSLSIARLAIQVLSTLLSVSSSDKQLEVFIPALPAVVRICEAFPPLMDDIITFLIQLGRISASFSSLGEASSPQSVTDLMNYIQYNPEGNNSSHPYGQQVNNPLGKLIQDTFSKICDKNILSKNIY